MPDGPNAGLALAKSTRPASRNTIRYEISKLCGFGPGFGLCFVVDYVVYQQRQSEVNRCLPLSEYTSLHHVIHCVQRSPVR